MRDYFDSYKVEPGPYRLDPPAPGLGKDELIKDNAAIDVERQNLWAAMGKLEQMIHMSKALDARLEEKAADLDISPIRPRPRRSAKPRSSTSASARRIC
jgi:hypothetical protein